MGFCENLRRRAENSFLAEDLNVGLPRITVVGNSRLWVENHQGILEYGEGLLRLRCGKNVVKITGTDLVLTELSLEELTVEGHIISIEYLT